MACNHPITSFEHFTQLQNWGIPELLIFQSGDTEVNKG